jgi:hypothetical protein
VRPEHAIAVREQRRIERRQHLGIRRREPRARGLAHRALRRRQRRQMLQRRAHVGGVAFEAAQDIGEDQIVVGAGNVVGGTGGRLFGILRPWC